MKNQNLANRQSSMNKRRELWRPTTINVFHLISTFVEDKYVSVLFKTTDICIRFQTFDNEIGH